MTGKFLIGYQGWHAAQGDGSAMNKYVHWGRFDNARPSPSDTIHDIWPDLSEFAADELFPTDLTLGNGQPAKAYSCYKSNTVVRHFRWMKENNIDGVMLQRFIKDIKLDASFKELRNKNLTNVRLGAETHGRVFCVMYDMSNDDPALFVDHLKTDWAELVSTYQITNSARYIRHKGKPVVGLWGLGFNHVNATPQQAQEIIDWFKTNGCTVVGGVSTFWRTLDPSGDALTNSAWAAVYRSFDVISPWSVGRYGEAEVNNAKNFNFIPDLAYCATNNMDYMPVVWPGYSSHNLNTATPLNGFPRNGGKFYWKQIHAALSVGSTMLYGGMFDEIEEATAIFKTAPTMATTPAVSPTNLYQFFALDVDGYSLPSDWYLRVTDYAGKMLRGEFYLTDIIPITPTNALTLISPNGGQTWTAGGLVTVTWGSTGIVSGVNIDLSVDGGDTWSRLAFNTTNSGTKFFVAPFLSSTNCFVRVTGPDGSPAEWSDAAFTITTNNANPGKRLQSSWTLAPGSRSYVTTDNSSTPFQRSIAYNSPSNQLYVISRTGTTTGLTVNALDATTGAHLHQLRTDGITGGNIILMNIAVADDGSIYAGNLSTSGGGVAVYRLYRWANSHSNTIPVRIFSGEPASRTDSVRWGDTLDARGSGTNTQIIIDVQATNLCAILTPIDSTLTNWMSVGGLQSYFGGSIGRSLQFGPTDTFWQKRKADRLQQSSFTLTNSTLTTAVMTNLNLFTSSMGPVGIDFNNNLIAGINFSSTTNCPDALELYDVSTLTNPVLLAREFFPTAQPNANFIGQVIVKNGKVFAVDGNNGIIALSVIDPPSISTQPANQTNFPGTTATFSVVVSGTAPFDFQWRKAGVNISSATNSSFAITNVQAGDGGNYSVVVANFAGSTTSSNALLTVVGPPVVVTQPQSQTVAAGANVSFTAEVTGSAPFTFQWKKAGGNLADGGNVSGATSATLTLTSVQSADAASYSLSVSNSAGSDTSASAVLTVVNPPVITTQPASQTIDFGNAANFSVVATGQNLAYQWRKNTTNLTDAGNISGATTANLSVSSVTQSDTANYSVVVSNIAGVVTSSTAGLVVNYPFPYYEPFNYTVAANLGGQTNSNGLVWYDVGTSTAGPYVTIESGNLSVPGLYSSSGNSMKFGGLGKSARFSFAPNNPATAGTLYYSFMLKVTDTNGLNAAGGFVAGFNNSVGTQTGQPTVVGTRVYLRSTNGGFNIGMSKNSSTTTDWIWDSRVFTNNETIFLVGSYTINSGSGTDDISVLWINPSSSGFGAGTPPPASLTNAIGNDLTANQIASFVFFQRSATTEPAAMIADELRMGNAWAQVTPSTLAAPVITTQPQSLVVNPGTAASFSVTASGSALNFQWRFNGTNILNATASNFTLTNAQIINEGNYSVVVSNGAGSVISSNASLNVAPSSVVTIDSNKVMVINGQKVFPITLSPGPPNYGKTPTGKDGLQELREAGALFTRIAQTTDWNSQLITNQNALLNWCYQNGMYCLVNLRELSHFSASNTTTEAPLRSLMAQFKNHPALGMWKNKDEAWWGGVSAEDLQRGYEVIKQEDTNHPVWQTHAPRGTVADLQPYNAAADVLAVDIYPVVASGSASNPPITNTQVSQVGDWTRALSQVANGEKPFWMIEQIAFSGTTPPAHTLVFPTFLQSRFMAYQAIINGARGLMFFGGNVAATLNAQDAPLGWNWTFWNDVLKPVVQELGDNSLLAEALVAPVSTLPITMSGTTDPDVEFCVREVPPYIYILASKREGATTNVTFSGLPAEAGVGDVLYESLRTVTAQNGQFTDSFAPLAVHVYRFNVTNQIPIILSQPQSRTNNAGTTATFSVVASGTAPLGYQWRKGETDLSDGGNISGAGTASLTLSNVVLSDATNYAVLVSNLAGSVLSSNAALVVITNTDFVAPVVSIISPANNAHTASGVVTVSGTAKDTAPGVIAGVKYRLWPETNWSSAAIVGGGTVTNWSASNVSLEPGTNMVHAYSYDGGGNPSPLKTNTFYYDLSSPLTVKIVGSGQVKSATLANIVHNQQISLLVGRPSSLTAFIASGVNYVFTNWTGGSNVNSLTNITTNLVYSFPMQTNLILQANFITNPFTPVAGSYAGLFSDTNNGVSHASAGFFTVKVTEKAAYSATFYFDGDKITASGKFDLSGQAGKSVSRATKGKGNVELFLALDWAGKMGGTLGNSNWTATLEGDRATFSLSNPATNQVGAFTFLVPRTNYPVQMPGGMGYAAGTNSLLGVVKISGGGLGDGAKLSQKVSLSSDGQWPFYAPLYKTTNTVTNPVNQAVIVNKSDYRGSVMGWVTFSNREPVGTLHWIKTAGASNYLYPNGFTSAVPLLGSLYTPPSNGVRALTITNGTATFYDGNLAGPIAWSVNWSSNNAITVSAGVIKPIFTLTPKTGLLKGTFPHPQLGNAPVNFFGAVLQNQNHGAGYFIGTNQSGSMQLMGN